MICAMVFGNIPYEHSMRSIELMSKEVIPAIKA
jgi:hypothetical protein